MKGSNGVSTSVERLPAEGLQRSSLVGPRSHPDDNWMTVKETAGVLGVSQKTVHHYIKSGKLRVLSPKKPIILDKRSVMDLKFSVKRSDKGWVPKAELIEAEWKELKRRRDEINEIHQRITHLEKLLGAREPTEEFTRPYYVSLLQSAVYRMASNEPISADERERWTNAIVSFDDAAIGLCAKDPALIELPGVLMKLAHRIHQAADQSLEKLHIMNAARQLRYLLRSIEPPKPVLQYGFELHEDLSPVDSLILSSCLKKKGA